MIMKTITIANSATRLNNVVDGAGDKAIANRRERKVKRYALRRFNDECFVCSDNRGHAYELAA